VTGLRRYAPANWRIRTRLVALLVLPVLAAIVLGGLRIQSSAQNETQLTKVSELSELAQSATALATALEDERQASAMPLTQGRKDDPSVIAARKATEKAQIQFTTLTNGLTLTSLPGGGLDVENTLTQLQQLSTIRDAAFPAGNNQQIQQTTDQYDYVIQSLLELSQDMAMGADNGSLIASARELEQFSMAKEDASIEGALLTAALSEPKKQLSTSDRGYLAHVQTQYTNALDAFSGIMGSSQAATILNTFTNNNEITAGNRFIEQVINGNVVTGPSQSMTALSWQDAAKAKTTAMDGAEQDLVQRLDLQAKSLRSQARSQTITSSVIIALVLIVAVLGAILVGRSMVRTLRKLQEAAEDVAQHRLPELVRTFSEADPQDVDVSVQPIGINTTDEIGHVAHAFDQVHSEAVRLAAEQALLRGNINAMFTNLSRRSQGLIQRQLSLISELESREADPDQLASLFKLDHLATRMRRNGENLLVLSGEDPGRRWTRPVPLVDVLRAAASEVEQYERIELASVPAADVVGRVVNDLVHLLAELLENATSFSSPQTRVKVTGHALPDGRVLVEIHDTGIGLSPDDLAEINERLANPPVVDVSVSRRMGLFVVGRLSLRHGIRIQLRPSDSGGTTALVMLPVDITNAGQRRGAAGGGKPAAQGGQGGQGGPSAPGLPGGRPEAPGRGGAGGGIGAAFQRGELPARGGGAVPPQRSGAEQGPGSGSGAGAGARGALPSGPAGPGAPAGPGFGNEPQQREQQLPAQQDPWSTAGATASSALPGGSERRPEAPRPEAPAQAPEWTRPAQERTGELSPWGDAPQHSAAGPDPRPSLPEPAAPEEQGLPNGMRGSRYPGQSPVERQAPAAQQAGPDSTMQFPRVPQPAPQAPAAPGYPQAMPQAPMPQAPQQPVPPQSAPQQHSRSAADDAHPLTGRELPAGGGAPERTPIFESMESNWFRVGRVDRMRAVHADQQPAGQQAPSQESRAPQAFGQGQAQAQGHPQGPAQQAAAPAGWGGGPQAAQQAAGAAPEHAPWRASENDSLWRQAEAVRRPSSGGTTPSGLPRRVPSANLVPGTATPTDLGGPQVDRSPEQVRGRLSSLRRGVQQGRMAGRQDGGSGENRGSGPYGPDRQER